MEIIQEFAPPLQLALKAAKSVSHIYNWLETFDQEREALVVGFKRLYVKDQEIKAATLKPFFTWSEDQGLKFESGPTRIRTRDQPVMSRPLYR